MRARNIKPSLFKNEILGTADPLLTILFEGLWCEADRDGRLEDRPLRLKAEILPYRNDADVDAMLNWLADKGFIVRYEVLSTKLIQVLKFSEHQRPHNNEVESVLPAMEQRKHNQGKKPAQPRRKALRSDSLILIPDSGSLIPTTSTSTIGRTADPNPQEVPRGTEAETHERVMFVKAKWPPGAAHEDWITAEKMIRNLISNGAVWDEIEAGVERYAKYCKATHRMVANPGKWFAEVSRPWLSPWALPNSKADNRLASNVEVMRQFVGGT